MALNLIPTVVKLAVGLMTNALSIIADGFNSVFDAGSNVVGLVGIWVASKPADEKYPYGKRKAETMTVLIICFMLFITAWELIMTAVDRLANPGLVDAEVNAWSFVAVGVSIAVHIAVVIYELGAGRRLHSDVLVADAMHTRADVFVSMSVGGGLVFIHFGVPVADPLLTIVVAVVTINIGIGIIKESVPTLIDKEKMPAGKVEEIVRSVPGICSVHHVRSRGHEQAVFADLHIRVDPGMSTEGSHAIAHEVEHRLRLFEPDLKDVTIHVEPDGSQARERSHEAIAIPLRRIAIGEGAQMHEIWVREVNGEYWIEDHLELDGSLTLAQAHAIVTRIENRIKEENPRVKEISSHIEPIGRITRGNVKEGEARILQARIMNVLEQVALKVKYHDVNIQIVDGKPAVSLHVAFPGTVSLFDVHGEVEILEQQLRAAVPSLYRVTIHSEPVDAARG
ncbi:MAG: cation diffusion facilitator family transporter [Candidatus Lokiarchaeota archaeon]|nr:cation diffusion facilitator family transporter [Candidatus Lokiarchaeota archaeon]